MESLFRTLTGPGVHVEYAQTAPADAVTVTRPYAIGVAFTPQTAAVWDIGDHTRRRTAIPGNAVFITASDPLYWQRWQQVSESIEIWLDPDRLNDLARESGGPSVIRFDHRDLVEDPVIVGIAARFRAALFDRHDWDPLRIEELATLLATHLLATYHGVKDCRGGRVRKIDAGALKRVNDYIAAHLDQAINLRTLAALAGRSPFHFAKSFKATTGVSPYVFVTDRRMDRSMVLLRTTDLAVRDVAMAVGFLSMSHFLTQFRRAWGRNPRGFRSHRGQESPRTSSLCQDPALPAAAPRHHS